MINHIEIVRDALKDAELQIWNLGNETSHIRDALASLAEIEKRTTWQPIESYVSGDDFCVLLWADWYKAQFIGYLVDGVWWTVDGFDEVYPTHWMLLPETSIKKIGKV